MLYIIVKIIRIPNQIQLKEVLILIKSFKKLGELELDELSPNEKKKKFLDTQTIEPNEPSEDDKDAEKYNEIIINLDTKNERIEIKQGKELFADNREEFFGFKLLGKRSKKIYFTGNNLYYHLLTIPQIIDYIEEKLNTENYSSFLEYLENMSDIFYDTQDKKSYLKLNLFEQDVRDKLHDYIGDKKISHKNVRKALEEYVSKDILGSSRKNFVNNLNIFSLKLNGKYITETKYGENYVDIVYYERQKRFFDTSDPMVKKEALCGVCNEKKLVTGKIDIPTKFYVTSSPYFFEDLNDKNAYKSFGMCQDCYQKVMVGISKVKNNYSNRLFNQLRYYVIPKNVDNQNNYKKSLRLIQNILSGKGKTYEKSIKNIKKVKSKNLKVDFLFWRPDQASFIVLDSINNVYYRHLQDIFSELHNLNMESFSSGNLSNRYKLKFNDLYWLLFPNYKSHNSPDPKLYRKEMLNLFDSILKNKEIDYKYLLSQFNFILRKRYFKNKKRVEEIIAHPLKMNLLLTWLSQITKVEGGFKVKEGKEFTEIEDPDIKRFFEVHAETYTNNSYRQGLFLLGVLMNQVLKEQQKENKSANIIDKISFDGMPVRRVKKFVKDITEILNIYDKYNINQLLHSQMIDRLQGIENSSLNKDEVVFYILSGISFGRYLGHKYSQNKGEEN